MSDMSPQKLPVPTPGGQDENVPPDLIPAHQAAAILACSANTLRRWSKSEPPKITAYLNPKLSGYFYRRSECEEIRSHFRRAE
ncbi:MAG TPA: hypothetical protein VMZ50_12475 [Phycisphaerae bacterium]|nr:hypothetical protein [Phycisphaerae bacterium]